MEAGKSSKLLTLMGCFFAASLLSQTTLAGGGAERGTILDVKRMVQLLEPDVITSTNLIKFKPGRADRVGERTVFEYIVAADYDDTLVAVDAISYGTHYSLQVQEVAGPLVSGSLGGYNSTDFLWFQIDVSDNMKHSDNGEVQIEVIEFHKRRREAFPTAVSLLEDQSMRLRDSRYLLSPYKVKQ